MREAFARRPELERRWWFAGLVALLATLAALYLAEGAGLPRIAQMSGYQLALYALAFGALWKLFSFLLFLLIVCVRPSAVRR